MICSMITLHHELLQKLVIYQMTRFTLYDKPQMSVLKITPAVNNAPNELNETNIYYLAVAVNVRIGAVVKARFHWQTCAAKFCFYVKKLPDCHGSIRRIEGAPWPPVEVRDSFGCMPRLGDRGTLKRRMADDTQASESAEIAKKLPRRLPGQLLSRVFNSIHDEDYDYDERVCHYYEDDERPTLTLYGREFDVPSSISRDELLCHKESIDKLSFCSHRLYHTLLSLLFILSHWGTLLRRAPGQAWAPNLDSTIKPANALMGGLFSAPAEHRP
uniref:Uncharacterized protein n=1 Tax=Romanomermis culicivorax TaxID=13658 RepID=A0A915J3Y2_ROMCU